MEMKMAKVPVGVGPKLPQIVVLFGATGDLAHKKLLPGLFRLATKGFIPKCRIVGVSLDAIDVEGFRALARQAVDKQPDRKRGEDAWAAFAPALDYVPMAAGPGALREAVDRAAKAFGGECKRVHYLSVPPNAALPAIQMLAEAELAEDSRVIMEKPFGTDLESAMALNAELHKVFFEEQIFRIDHFLGKEPAQNILAFRFANGLFEPIWNRNFIDHVQIDVPETLDLGARVGFYEQTGAYRDMVVTHLFQILAFMAMEPPTSLAPGPISEEKNKVFRSLLPVDPAEVVRGQFIGYKQEKGVDPESDTETFIALKCRVDNWRWAGVPFYLRTGKRMAEGQRIISIAFREPPRSMFPGDSGIASQGPDHLTFDLADQSKVSLSFYGKKPGPGMRLAKQSLQFALHDTGLGGDVLEAYERLILDAMRGDHTLFCTADGIERLWDVSTRLLEEPPPVRMYSPGSWGPQSIYQLIAPHAWRLPFERAWRDPNVVGA
jgi:glucose-6-phosphate 1-dehydrogenase